VRRKLRPVPILLGLVGLGIGVVAVLALREQYPRWGKGKLQVLLQQYGRLVEPARRFRARESSVLRLAWLTGPSPTARRFLMTRFRV
jgi:hypothetical protein